MDLNNLQTWQYFALGGAGVLVVAFILYFVPAGKMRLPAVVTAAFAGAVSGLALGVLLMASFGYKAKEKDRTESDDGAGAMAKGPPGAGGGGEGRGKGPPKGGSGGGGQSGPKTQLADLVIALDRLADRPVTITLTPTQRRTIAYQLRGLDTADELSEADAREKVEAIHKVVQTEYEALADVGYRSLIPGKGGGGGGPGGKFGPPKDPPANPFKAGPAADRLKSLLERLNAKK